MSDDYLWDGSGSPGAGDEDIVRLEQKLAPLRRPLGPPPSLGDAAARSRAATPAAGAGGRTIRFLGPALAAAAVIAMMVAQTWRSESTGAAWDVARIAGQPLIESMPLTGTGRMAVGETLATDDASRARIDVSSIGQVNVDPNTRVRLVGTRTGRHTLALERGTLHAFITAPPGQFVVNTRSATATDLGCVYTLTVDADGSGVLRVAAGWVAFEYRDRESFVPAGASARTNPRFGPGTPRYDDADAEFRAALERLDYGADGDRAAALRYVVAHARDKDAMTLWHLIARVAGSDRDLVVAALEAHVPLPPGTERAAVLRLDRAALDSWWDALGLSDASWWRTWKTELR